MRKLLGANLSCLWKEISFWFALGFMSIGSAVVSWMRYNAAMQDPDVPFYVEDIMFNMLPIMCFVFAIVISMHLGTEFDEHTIRNKLIVGYTRTQVYFAEYIACLLASLILFAAMLLISILSGWVLFHKFLCEPAEIGFLLLCCALMASVFSAMITGICMNIHSKATSIVISLIFLLAIVLQASFCINALAEPSTTYSSVEMTMEGVQFGERIDNPAYIGGVQRTLYELIADALPTGQTIQLNNLEYARADRWPLLSIIMLAIATAAGYLPFRKKDIR